MNCIKVLSLLMLPVATTEATGFSAEIVHVGKGSYTVSAPPGMKLPPRTISQTENVTGKMPTNDWWSSLAWEPFSSNQFPHPLAVRATESGLRISYPGANLRAVEKHAFGSMTNDLVLGHSAVTRFSDARVDGFSDWFVRVAFIEGDRKMLLSYGHGSPFVYAIFDNGGAAIRFDGKPRVWAGDSKTPTLGVTIKGRHYGLFGPAGSSWTGLDQGAFVNQNQGKRHFSLALLPDSNLDTLRLFQQYAHSHVVGTKVNWRYLPAQGVVETTFAFETTVWEGTGQGTLFALYPHQWMTTRHELLPYIYASIRGPMKLGAGSRFTTTMRFPGVLPALPDTGSCDRACLGGYLDDALRKRFNKPADTYWCGKVLGAIAGLVPVAEQADKADVATRLRDNLRGQLEAWFSAPGDPPKTDRYFYYDEKWGALIGQRPSYGSNDQLNDHHFHYGYFIRAAAEIARTDKAWARDDAWGGMVKLLIRDIAADRNDPLFPYLRCFDPYAGHSWASGHAKFGDGNNQESSSEAMNAWTGMVLWGEATGDRDLRDLGIYLYTTELQAINAYWFDIEDRLFPDGYNRPCASLIWGGKTDYATWFSGEPEHIHGIVLLPIQSGSLYLGLYPDYVRRNLEGLAEQRGSDQWKHWPEIFWMYEALDSPDAAARRFDAGAGKADPHARPFAYHWISNLAGLGQVDRTVTADHPLAVAFSKGSQRTYVAYNMANAPVTVTFSDGYKLDASMAGFAVGRRLADSDQPSGGTGK